MKKFAILSIALILSLAILPCYAEKEEAMVLSAPLTSAAPDTFVSPDAPVSSDVADIAKDAVDMVTDNSATGEILTTGTVGTPELDSDAMAEIGGVDGPTATLVSESDGFVFTPENFTANLGYMGAGMLGIFIVIGIIVLSTVVLNKLFREKSDKAQ